MQSHGQAIFLVFLWRQPASSYPEENVSPGYCRAEDLGGDCRSPTASPEWAHLFKGHAPAQLETLVFAWPGLIWPKVMQQQKCTLHAVYSCEHSPLLYASCAPCCSCHTIILTFIIDHCGTVWLFCGFYHCFALPSVGYNTVTEIKYFGSEQNKCLKIWIITLIYPINPVHKT